MIKGVFATDLHFPDHDPQCVKVLKSFLKDFKPNVFIMGGDWMNMNSMSHWAEKRDRIVELSSIKDEYDAFNKFLDDFLKVLPYSCVVYFMIGNHEDWARQYLLANPKYRGYIELQYNLRLKERGIRVIDLNRVLAIGKMHFMHGIYTNDHHTKKMCQNFNKNIFYAHTHDIQVYTMVSLDNDYHTAQSVGCLCKMEQNYLKGTPTRWNHGFLSFYQDSHSFHAYQLRIVKGRTIFAGKEYK